MVIVHIKDKERSCQMFIAIVVSLLLFGLAGADLFVAQYNSDELSNMGVEQK